MMNTDTAEQVSTPTRLAGGNPWASEPGLGNGSSAALMADVPSARDNASATSSFANYGIICANVAEISGIG